MYRRRTTEPRARVFVFLQGPHGPFFDGLARALRSTGAATWRVGFNSGDRLFWRGRDTYIPFSAPPDVWPERIADVFAEAGATDLVLYGDTRPIHAEAIAQARARGITVHVFEEGYLRPYWITYERGGANGHSALMQLELADMQAALGGGGEVAASRPAPARWGDLRQHVFYGALYHFCVLALNRRYRMFKPHRALSVGQEFRLYLRRLALMPLHWADRVQATRRITRGGFPYHLVLMQLAHDASFRDHGPFADMEAFITHVLEGFARGAPVHHHLVFKAHPLDDGRAPIRRDIARVAARLGLSGRVHFVRGGKLAKLLDEARSAVTVNSTAAQQALWRGLPLKAFGQAVYLKPEFVADQSLPDFFADPREPDSTAYRIYRQYLLETSQISGSYYAARGRRRVLRVVVDMMLAPTDRYSALEDADSATKQHLNIVR